MKIRITSTQIFHNFLSLVSSRKVWMMILVILSLSMTGMANLEINGSTTSAWQNTNIDSFIINDTITNNYILFGTSNNTDIAINKNTVATSEYSGDYLSGKAVDNDLNTAWYSSNTNVPQNHTIYLNNIYEIRNMTYWQGTIASTAVATFKLFSSVDDITYNIVIPTTSTISVDDGGLQFTFNKTFLSKYIRFQVISGEPSYVITGIGEAFIYKNDLFTQGNITSWYDSGSGNEVYKIDVNATTPTNTNIFNKQT